MTQTFGSGELGQITYGTRRYQITWDDLLWAGRMVLGESGSDLADGAAVLWAMTQLLAKSNSSNFTRLIRAYSTPIQERNAGSGRPQQIQATSWENLSSNTQDLVVRWARNQLNNPVHRATDFAVPAVACRYPFRSGTPMGAEGLRLRGFELVYDARGRGPDSLAESGNAFYSTERSRSWPANYVTITYQGSQSSITTPETIASTLPTSTSTRTVVQSSTEQTFERNFAMTQARTEPPNTDYDYYNVNSRIEDPQTNNILSEDDERIVLKTGHTRFFEQIEAIKQESSLEMSRVVPIIEITAEDKAGEIVNLTDLIFAAPILHNLLEDSNDFNAVHNAEFSERPLASVESLNISVQTPQAGGMAEITIAKLTIVVTNPSIVNPDHPKGRYIHYLMLQGYSIRIKYGWSAVRFDDGARQAYQWKEQGFFVSRHQVTLNDDKTARIEIELLPSTQKLMNQILIGESIPVDDIRQISPEDINQVLDSITAGDNLDSSQVEEIRRRIQAFAEQFNTAVGTPSSPGMRMARGTGVDENSFGSILHGAIKTSQVLNRPSGISPIIVQSTVMALNSIQSLLLTRRYEQIINRDAYRHTLNGTTFNAVNMGPLVLKLAKPEIDAVAAYTSANNMQIGEINSLDASQISPTAQQPPRSNVQLIFGNFNSLAGQWANRPISAFPINIDTIFGHLRTRRNLGQFSSHINAFFNNLSSIIHEEGNYTFERRSGETNHPFERPQIKYAFYPDPRPDRTDNWIFYIYDYKVPFVQFRILLDSLGDNETVAKADLLERLQESNIPWLEMGTEGSIIKTMSANTEADDTLQAHLMLQANRSSVGIRQQEDSECPPGVSAEFWDGANLDPNQVINTRMIFMPLRVRATLWMLTSAMLFAPIFIFNPLESFSQLFIPNTLTHQITPGTAVSMMDLNVQVAGGFRRVT